jgi:predicted type IV restriction endonuclease
VLRQNEREKHNSKANNARPFVNMIQFDRTKLRIGFNIILLSNGISWLLFDRIAMKIIELNVNIPPKDGIIIQLKSINKQVVDRAITRSSPII